MTLKFLSRGSHLHIAEVETLRLRHQLARPTGPASVLNSAREALLIKVSTDSGLVGWGETYALAGVRDAIDRVVAPLLVGRDPLEVRVLWRSMWDATFGNGFAVGGVDIALHDVWGKALGVPVHQLYGGAWRLSVPAYASGLCYFADLDALPADVKLVADAWGSYTPPVALKVARALERLGVYWFEEPLPQAGYAGYPAAFNALIDARAVDIVQPDVSICGGIAECLFVADLARLAGIQTAPHSWNGPIMQAATLHVAALLPDPSRMPGVETPMLEVDTTENPFMTDLLVEPLCMRDGCIEVPTRPGLGVDEVRARVFAVGE